MSQLMPAHLTRKSSIIARSFPRFTWLVEASSVPTLFEVVLDEIVLGPSILLLPGRISLPVFVLAASTEADRWETSAEKDVNRTLPSFSPALVIRYALGGLGHILSAHRTGYRWWPGASKSTLQVVLKHHEHRGECKVV